MKVSLEYLYHYSCDRDDCQKWWTIADIIPFVGQEMHCPHCGHLNKIEGLTSHEIKAKPKAPQPVPLQPVPLQPWMPAYLRLPSVQRQCTPIDKLL